MQSADNQVFTQADLAVGIPYQDVVTVEDAGAILVMYSATPPFFSDGFESGDLAAWTP